MANIDTPITSMQLIGTAVNASVVKIKHVFERRALYKRTLRELQCLSNRDLVDLGIHPSMIESIAYEAAYKRKA